jgi:hypothetical protein
VLLLVVCAHVASADAPRIAVSQPPPTSSAFSPGYSYGQLTVAFPLVRVAAQCWDLDPQDACVKLRVLDAAGHQLAIGLTSVDASADLSAYNGQLTTLRFEATDSGGNTTTETVKVYVEVSGGLSAVVTGGSSFWDATATKFLLGDVNGEDVSIVVVDRATGLKTGFDGFSGHLGHGAAGFLMTDGGIWLVDMGRGGVRVGSTSGGRGMALRMDSFALRRSGDFAVWARDGQLCRYQSSTRAATCFSTAQELFGFSVAANGDVVWQDHLWYWDPFFGGWFPALEYPIWRYREGQVTQLAPTMPRGVSLITDGINVAYGGGVLLANGWIATLRNDPAGQAQVWVRSPEGAESQVSSAPQSCALEALSDTGEVMFKTGGRRYFGAPDRMPLDISSTQGRAFWADGQWYVHIGRTAFAANTADRARMTSPDESQPLPGPSVAFTWKPALDASQYWLDIGTAAGGTGLYSASQGTALSQTIAGLPADGSPIHVRLWTLVHGRWLYDDRPYTAATAGDRAVMRRPAHAATLSSSSVTFAWTPGAAGSSYWLDVGTTPGGSDLYAGSQGTALSRIVLGLPTDGRTLYGRLWTLANSRWQFADYTYVAATSTTRAMLIRPAEGEVLTSASAVFAWTEITGAQHWLDIGTTSGGTDVYSATQRTNRIASVTGLPMDGRAIFVRLWTLAAGAWQWADYRYDTIDAQGGSTLVNPTQSDLPSPTATFTWTPGTTLPSYYWLDVGTTPGGTDVYSASQQRGLTATIDGLPSGGSPIYVRLWSLLPGRWASIDYVFSTAHADGAALLLRPIQGETLADVSSAFTWSAGIDARQYWIDVGTSPGGTDVYSRTQGAALATRIDGLPATGAPLYVRLWTLHAHEWVFVDYTFATADPYGGAVMVGPTPSLPLVSEAVTFTWSLGGVNSRVPLLYWLDVGTRPGESDLYSAQDSGSHSATVPGLPTDGRRVYVRVWTLVDGDYRHWVARDYVYRTGVATWQATAR